MNQEMINFIEKYGVSKCKVALEEYEKTKKVKPIPVRGYIIHNKLYVSTRDLFSGLKKSPSREYFKIPDTQKKQVIINNHRINLIDINYLANTILQNKD